MISRITEIATLTFAAPIAWKNTGVIRENTAEKKLSPIMRNAGMPTANTSASREKMLMTWLGSASKQNTPTSMNASDKMTESRITARQRR